MASEEMQCVDAGSVVSLREITKETVRDILKLRVAPEQESFVAPNAVSIAQAYFEEVAWFRAIYADDTPVGFVMLYDDPAKPEYMLWRFMIDAQFQKYGFGRTALELIIAHVRTRPGATVLFTSCVPGDGSPCPFYEKMGFVDTGEVDEDEKVLRYDL